MYTSYILVHNSMCYTEDKTPVGIQKTNKSPNIFLSIYHEDKAIAYVLLSNHTSYTSFKFDQYA